VVLNVRRGNKMAKPMTCPAVMYAVMSRCWEILPAKRATAKEIQGMLAAITLDQLDSDLIQVLLFIALLS
jgi:hypothetical protein